jgi:hypothetical protein
MKVLLRSVPFIVQIYKGHENRDGKWTSVDLQGMNEAETRCEGEKEAGINQALPQIYATVEYRRKGISSISKRDAKQIQSPYMIHQTRFMPSKTFRTNHA